MTFELADLPAGAVVTSPSTSSRWRARRAASPSRAWSSKGELRTNVQINGKFVDYLNRHITSKNETPERIRLPIPAGLLRAGENRLRIEQVAEASNPNSLDDLGVLGIALESDRSRRPPPVKEP